LAALAIHVVGRRILGHLRHQLRRHVLAEARHQRRALAHLKEVAPGHVQLAVQVVVGAKRGRQRQRAGQDGAQRRQRGQAEAQRQAHQQDRQRLQRLRPVRPQLEAARRRGADQHHAALQHLGRRAAGQHVGRRHVAERAAVRAAAAAVLDHRAHRLAHRDQPL
ncbi:conserved hypothetical protein, partial [Ricinus communis]